MSTNPNQQAKADTLNDIYEELSKVVVGRQKECKLFLMALLSKGHVLLEDMPGMGKTSLVKAFSKILDCEYKRVQCTPDLLPSDVTGVSVFNPKTSEFSFRKGPVFTQILLVDEINRALPRTQSSLLESMEERQISVEGGAYELAEPFMVLATQNPVETQGTFPLPEAQLDRFLIKLRMGYLSQEDEEDMLENLGNDLPFDRLANILDASTIADFQKQSENVHVHPNVRTYIVKLAHETRQHPLIEMGISPRASKAMYQAVKAWAFLDGREYVQPDDVKDLLPYVWSHRLILTSEASFHNWNTENLLAEEIVKKVKLPEENVERVT
ncbi:MoxR family ATPase [Salibacterium salarium]|uniref:MoxR family ATPase n=1 Tax=Salibacterium salarium TaxID=284579 RepID=A0A3R9QGG1_9BACI|nr:MoxR family ATPase [Salibacterium salarium]RSL29983.1 MoxR family ATPase [Salibacterium salarium]